MGKGISSADLPNPKRDYEFVLQLRNEAEKQAKLARTCEWHIVGATGKEADAIADAADKAVGIAKERATDALSHALETAGVHSSDTVEHQFGELALHAAAETVHAAAEALKSARIVGEFWFEEALSRGEEIS